MESRMDYKIGLLLGFVLLWMLIRPVVASVVEEYKLQPFDCNGPDCDRIISVHQHKDTGNLYVTTRGSVKELDSDLNETHDRKTGLDRDGHNVLMLLMGTEFILCHNDLDGTCELRDVDNLDLVEAGHSNALVVPPGGSDPVGWIDKGPGESNVLHVAVGSGETQGGSIPLLATRSVNNGSLSPAEGFLDYLKDEYSVPASYFKSGPCLGADIEPFYGFSTGNYRYLLKKHRKDGPGELAELKIVQLCRDAPSYRSYVELPIECNEGGDSESEAKDGGGVLVSTAAHFAEGHLYISLSKNTSGGFLQTHVCNYSMERVVDQFRQRRRECLEGRTETTELAWSSYNRCPSEALPPSKFNYSRLDDDDFCYDMDIAQPLGGTTAIQGTAMGLLTRKDVITALLVVTSDGGTTYILGDKEGFIHKISDDSSELELVDKGHEILSVGGLILHPEEDRIYASSIRRIIMTRLDQSWTTETPPPITTTPESHEEGNKGFDMMHLAWIIPLAVVVLAALIFAAICWVKHERGESAVWKS